MCVSKENSQPNIKAVTFYILLWFLTSEIDTQKKEVLRFSQCQMEKLFFVKEEYVKE